MTYREDKHMSYETTAANAAEWALGKVGCAYSQAKRTQENIFDCSSLVARAYSAQGKRWRYGGSVPTSTKEVYDDDFELLWPESYASIGKSFGGESVLRKARQPGDLQFLCTDSDTGRSNRITHVAMMADEDRIVHARSTRYGVCTNDWTLYAGKVCAICRYNPSGTLRTGMKGYRTLALQQALNRQGASLDEDGEYGGATANAVKAWQAENGRTATGEADRATLEALGLLKGEAPENSGEVSETPTESPTGQLVEITGGTVNVRTGPGTDYAPVKIAKQGETYEAVDTDGWQAILLDGEIRWVSRKFSRALKFDENDEEIVV